MTRNLDLPELAQELVSRLDPATPWVQELAREIAARLDPEALWDAKNVGLYLNRSARYVTEELAGTPGFPAAIRLPGPAGRVGNPLWRRKAILWWVEKCERGRKPQGGRPRNKPADE